jgi:hypothetical protein
MKINNHIGSIPALSIITFAFLSALACTNAEAVTVSGGSLILDLDRDAIIAGSDLNNFPDTPTDTFPICCRPSIYLEEFYDASAANLRTFDQIRDDNTPDLFDAVSDEISAKDLQFSVNGPVVNNLNLRFNQPTTFSFDANNLFGTAAGSIGLGGVMRFRVDIAPPTNRVHLGDMALEYHPNLEGLSPGRSGWLLVNNIGFTADAFELYNVTTQLTDDTLSLNGTLGFGWGFDHLGATQARLNHTPIGTFSFKTTVVPVPTAVWFFISGLTGLFVNSRSHRKLPK